MVSHRWRHSYGAIGPGLAFGFTLWSKHVADKNAATGLDLSRVRQTKGTISTTVSNCEVRVVEGRLEEWVLDPGTTVVLPCNEYFDDQCVGDTKSALGAYVNKMFEGQVDSFISLAKGECKKKLGSGVMEHKTSEESEESFGAGRCVLIQKPLGKVSPIALVSTTTQRAGEGLVARISYLFEAMRALTEALADARLNDVVMPVLGAGHGRIDTPLAFVGLLLAVAEAARYGKGGQRLRRVTIVVYKRDADSPPQVDPLIVQRALALVATRD